MNKEALSAAADSLCYTYRTTAEAMARDCVREYLRVCTCKFNPEDSRTFPPRAGWHICSIGAGLTHYWGYCHYRGDGHWDTEDVQTWIPFSALELGEKDA